MKDIDGNFCDGNGRLLPQTGEEWQDKLRRDRDQPKKQELPPLIQWNVDGMWVVSLYQAQQYRTQLLAALSDNEALRAKLKSVEGLLEEKLAVHGGWRLACEMYAKPDVDALLARIREAIK